MDERINELIDIIKFLVEVDTGISKSNSKWILKCLDELKDGGS